MASQEANIKIRLDTKEAESALRGLNKTASGVAKQVGGGGGGGGGGKGVAFGVGALAGAAVSRAKGVGTSLLPTELLGSIFGPTMEGLKAFPDSQIDAAAMAKNFPDLPGFLMGAQKDKAGRDRVADAAYRPFRIHSDMDAIRMRGMRDFAQRARFSAAPGDAEVATIIAQLAKIGLDILQALKNINRRGGGKK